MTVETVTGSTATGSLVRRAGARPRRAGAAARAQRRAAVSRTVCPCSQWRTISLASGVLAAQLAAELADDLASQREDSYRCTCSPVSGVRPQSEQQAAVGLERAEAPHQQDPLELLDVLCDGRHRNVAFAARGAVLLPGDRSQDRPAGRVSRRPSRRYLDGRRRGAGGPDDGLFDYSEHRRGASQGLL